MVKKIITTLTLAAAALVMASCGGKVEYANTVNGVYYWRGVYDLDNKEQEFLKQNNIRKMYMRFFDVEECDYYATEKYAPMYTLELRSKLPDSVEIIPTVFITTSAIKNYEDYYQHLARRIYAMCDSYDITPKEIQFDCDWTTSTRESFFAFLKDVRTELEQYFPGIRLSSTIRLHQLSQTPPPVDEGVLMCYNTGDFKDFNTKNSILDIKDVKPYLKYLKSYDLPLSLALPTYDWIVEFDSDKKFSYLNNWVYFPADTVRVGENLWRYNNYDGNCHYMRHETVSAKTILETKDLVQKAYGKKMNIILYHLNSTQLKKYTNDEIEDFYL